MRRRLTLLSIGALGVAVVASGCTSTGNGTGTQSPAPIQTGFIGTAADSKGPAAPVPGANRGGTITVLQNADFDHLDPARSYVNIQQIVGTLITRSLTTYKEV